MIAINLGDWLSTTYSCLSSVSETPQLEAQIIAAHILNVEKVWVMTHSEAVLSCDQLTSLDFVLDRLMLGEPLPYILGEWEFYVRPFFVSPDVLIPRPETELMVEESLKWLEEHPFCRHGLDVGTGSGCIAVSLACAVADLDIVAVDISLRALSIARQNVLRHNIPKQVHLLCSDLTGAVGGMVDLICANLPYIPSQDIRQLKVAVYEPKLALDGGADGLACIRRLLQDAKRILATDSLMLLEIEARQGETATTLARAYFPNSLISLLFDLAGMPRLIRIETHES